MIGPSFLIGLGSTGVQVLARVQQLLGSTVPETVRLLAFDMHHPRLDTTGRLGPAHYFLAPLTPVDEANLSPRRAVRAALLKDLRRGPGESQVLRNLNLNLDALRAALLPSETVDVFLVTSSFGSSGSGLLLDVAYLCRHLAQKRPQLRVHVLLVAPEAYQHGQTITKEHYLQNFALLKEIEFMQCGRNWSTPYSLYGPEGIAGIPGLMTAPPFDTLQLLDGFQLNTGPEAGVVAAAAEGLLCQMDDLARKALDEIRAAHPSQGRACFSAFGVFSYYHPTRLLTERSAQRMIAALVETLFPLEKNELTGRPEKLAERTPLREDDPYGNLNFWLAPASISGVLEEVLQVSQLPQGANHPERLQFLNRLVRRARIDWERVYHEAGDRLKADKGFDRVDLPEEHVRVLFNAILQRVMQADDRLGPLSVYLSKLNNVLSYYLDDLQQVEEIWKGMGEHSECEAVRKELEDARRELEEKRNSNWSKLFSQGVEAAEQRLEKIVRSRTQLQEREAIVQSIRKTVEMMRTLSNRLLEVYEYYAQAAALAGGSIFNAAVDQGLLVERELRFESNVRTQQVIVDQGFENRRMRVVSEEFNQRFFSALQKHFNQVIESIDWEHDGVSWSYPLNLGQEEGGSIDLLDINAPAEERGRQIWDALGRWFEQALVSGQPETSILSFLSYHDSRGDRLATKMSEHSVLLAKLLAEPPTQDAVLFAPEPDALGTTPHTQDFITEIQHHFASIYLAESRDADRLVLLRWCGGLTVDSFFTYHQSAPKKIDPSELRDYILW